MYEPPPDAAADDVILGMLPYAHQRGGFVIRPDDQGKIKGNALLAMEQQLDSQLQQIYGQVEVLARQARALKHRADISYKIYQCDLRFDPIIGHTYYLYERTGGAPWLSLIAPEEWKGQHARHLATARLLADHTWEVLDSPPEPVAP